jgi:hypothetical protein
MKPILLLLAAIALPTTLFGQGVVLFRNDSTTLFSTNGGPGRIGLMSGAGNYRIGLYTAPSGTTTESLFTLVLLATNSATPGQFGDPNQSPIPSNAGTPIAIQVRAWSTFAGATYESAAATAASMIGPDVYLGQTPLGTIIPAIGGAPSQPIFGPGGVFTSGIVLYGPVPEPPIYALAVLGALMFFCCRKKSVRSLR